MKKEEKKSPEMQSWRRFCRRNPDTAAEPGADGAAAVSKRRVAPAARVLQGRARTCRGREVARGAGGLGCGPSSPGPRSPGLGGRASGGMRAPLPRLGGSAGFGTAGGNASRSSPRGRAPRGRGPAARRFPAPRTAAGRAARAPPAVRVPLRGRPGSGLGRERSLGSGPSGQPGGAPCRAR